MLGQAFDLEGLIAGIAPRAEALANQDAPGSSKKRRTQKEPKEPQGTATASSTEPGKPAATQPEAAKVTVGKFGLNVFQLAFVFFLLTLLCWWFSVEWFVVFELVFLWRRAAQVQCV